MLTVGDAQDPLMRDLPATTQVWMSHGDTITRVPEGYGIVASTEDVRVAAFQIGGGERTWGIQFHPEVYHSTDGKQLLKNFVVGICGCAQSWTSESFVESTVRELREKLGDDRVVLGLSGGVDSTVAAVLLHRAIGRNLYCIFVDSGLLRKNEFDEVLESYRDMGLNVKGVKAGEKFLADLAGVSEPERKRKIIGRDFVEVFNEEAQRIEDVRWLAQGTIYPDVIESCSVNGPSATIKSHHNVGGLPEKMNLKIVEPLRLLFKDEVRRVGRSLGISERLIGRHPFPGPGLAIRILGDVTAGKVEILQNVDRIYIDALRAAGLYDKVWQAGAILLPVKSVGVMGDERTYGRLRRPAGAVTSTDGMTADWVASALRIPRRRVGTGNHQQGPRREPRGLRHLLQAARHDRVGVADFPSCREFPESGRPSRNMLRLGRFHLRHPALAVLVSLAPSPGAFVFRRLAFLGDMSFALRGFGGFPAAAADLLFLPGGALSLLRKEFFFRK